MRAGQSSARVFWADHDHHAAVLRAALVGVVAGDRLGFAYALIADSRGVHTGGSQPGPVKILSLPTEARPASFAGAVGKFEITAEATPTQVAAGDPVTLKVTALLSIGKTERFGFSTAAIPVGRDVWVGSAYGDRIGIFTPGH